MGKLFIDPARLFTWTALLVGLDPRLRGDDG